MKLKCIWMVPKNLHSPFLHQFGKKNDDFFFLKMSGCHCKANLPDARYFEIHITHCLSMHLDCKKKLATSNLPFQAF